MKVSQIAAALQAAAPVQLAADWDNVGLLIGDGDSDATGLLLCIDLTAAVLDEAHRLRAGMVMAYHPIIFKPVSRLTSAAAPVAYAAIRAGVSVYSMHTALDSAPGGTSDVLADVLGLKERTPLECSHRDGECKVVTFVPPDQLAAVAQAAFAAGAGRIGNYFDCAFFGHGIGAFNPGPGSHPARGSVGEHEAAEEIRLEVTGPVALAGEIRAAIGKAHPYEEPVIDVYRLEPSPAGVGLGRVGTLAGTATIRSLIARAKKAAGVSKALVALALPAKGKAARETDSVTVAACSPGSCGSLYKTAIAAGATFYLTGEMRHHDAQAAAAGGLTVVCLGHSNSERMALAGLATRLRKDLPGVQVAVSKTDRDPFLIS